MRRPALAAPVWLPGMHGAALQQSQFRRPVRQCQAQPFDVRVPCPKLRLDFPYFLAATFDSCRLLAPFYGDHIEGAAIAIENRGLSRVFLIARADDVGVPAIDLHEPRFASLPLAGD